MSRSPWVQRWAAAALAPALLLLSGCAVTESTVIPVEPKALAYAPLCESTLGSYSLPRAFLRVKIGQADATSAPDIALVGSGDTATPVQVALHPDAGLTFCLDHLASPLADETITITKAPLTSSATNPKTPFLGAVMVNVTDQTAYIVEALLRASLIGVTGDPGFRAGRVGFTPEQIVADIEFDPFDQVESAGANARLAKLGFCFVLENYTFGPRVTVGEYCSDPLRHSRVLTRIGEAYLKAAALPANPHTPGIVYRPRHPYRLFIYHKRNLGGIGPWELVQSTTVQLENMSPVISLGITRGMFAGKRVNFIFDSGALQTVCVAKTSELQGFVEIPLAISKAIVAVPASIVSVQIGRAQDQQNLIQAQQQLYNFQQAYLQTLAGQRPGAPGSVPAVTKPTAIDTSNFGNLDTGIPKQAQAPLFGDGYDPFSIHLGNICQGLS
ncbi:MAG TPA: hypothetical protein VGG01_18125 [Xanthobacteraceae bacterium]|jgi:hypothetical protein